MEKSLKLLLEHAKKDKNVLAVIVFGSYARKEPYRDIDVALIAYPKEYASKEMFNALLEYAGISDKLDVHVFQQLPLYIQERVLKEGKLLLCKNEDMLYDIVFEAIRKIDDFMPYYESYLEGVMNA